MKITKLLEKTTPVGNGQPMTKPTPGYIKHLENKILQTKKKLRELEHDRDAALEDLDEQFFLGEK